MTTDGKKIARIVSLSILLLFILGYGTFRASGLLFGVKIKDINISEGAVIEESIFVIRGNAKNAIEISINGREIWIDQEGNFHEAIAFLPGYNMVNIQAKDKFGNRDEKNYQLIFAKAK
ncbi:MAG TPA: hypothetical protein VFQ59_02045 [Candidatus Paceibacterota bacterium]|nr:hypothetical protein [Candidatus Paceibacterota bacterium]